jgi:sugar/nucleoside kinase (ribokinase family)
MSGTGVGGSPRAAVVGPVNMDLFIRGAAPLDREVLNGWVGPSTTELLVAGSIGYTIGALARLGWAVEVCSTTGDDAFGAYIRADLEARGLDCRHLARAPGKTAIAIYMMLWGGIKRPMTYLLPGFEPWPDPPPLLAPGEPLPRLLHSGGLLHFPGMYRRGLAALFARARAARVMTSIDPQFPLVDTPAPWLPFVADVLEHADVLLCDEGEACQLFAAASADAAVAPAHAAGPRVVAIKRGARGALVSDGRTVLDQPAAAVDQAQVVEAVGAGDAFDAGLLDALARGEPLAAASRWATATAYLSLTGRGGAEGIADRDAVAAALAQVPQPAAG